MKTVRIVIFVFGAMVSGAVLWALLAPVIVGEQAVQDQRDEYYTCPMHPSVRSDRPGACPVCGMALVKKSALQEMSGDDLGSFRGISLSPTQRVIANISTIPARRGTLRKEVRSVGVVVTAEPLQATVAARFRGRIEKLHANTTGQLVQRGEPLFELYSPDLISAEQEFLLTLEGLRQGTGSSLQEQLTRTARERLKVHFGLTESQIREVESAGHIKNTASFYSPITGTVLQKQVVEGQYVDEGTVLYTMADLSLVWVILDVYEQDIAFVKKGQPIIVSSTAYPGKEFSGKVTFIEPVLNPETRTIRVRTEFANPANMLMPNMFVEARIRRSINNVISLPASAVLATGSRNVVWVEVGDNMFEPREVVVGMASDSKIEILRGLEEGEMVVATGGYLIESESALQLPGVSTEHAGHDMSSKKEATNGVVNEVTITVQGGYSPGVVRLKRGIPATLHFYRPEDSRCSDEVVIEAMGVKQKLAAWRTTTIRFTPEQAGEYTFTCGMDMIHGKIVVEH